jgi:hypothetical protein
MRSTFKGGADALSRIADAFGRLFLPERRAWRGEVPLGRVFWVHGIAASLVIAALHATALDLGQLALQQALILVSAAYTVWIVVAIWRSASRAAPFWGNLARWLTVAWALNSVLVLAFLQIELILRYARG